MKFDYYLFNSYVPEADGDATALYAKWFEQVAIAEELGYGCAWLTEHHFLDRLALRFDFGGLPQHRVLSSMRLFATEVAPHFVD